MTIPRKRTSAFSWPPHVAYRTIRVPGDGLFVPSHTGLLLLPSTYCQFRDLRGSVRHGISLAHCWFREASPCGHADPQNPPEAPGAASTVVQDRQARWFLWEKDQCPCRVLTGVDGVILLSPSCDVLHMSPRAADLTGGWTMPSTRLPSPLHHIAEEIREYLLISVQEGNGMAPELQRLVRTEQGTLFVRGFGMPDRDGHGFLTVLVVSERPVTLVFPGDTRRERPPP